MLPSNLLRLQPTTLNSRKTWLREISSTKKERQEKKEGNLRCTRKTATVLHRSVVERKGKADRTTWNLGSERQDKSRKKERNLWCVHNNPTCNTAITNHTRRSRIAIIYEIRVVVTWWRSGCAPGEMASNEIEWACDDERGDGEESEDGYRKFRCAGLRE